MLLIKCEIELDLSCSKGYIISEISITPEARRYNPMSSKNWSKSSNK